jgi:putative membrane protein
VPPALTPTPTIRRATTATILAGLLAGGIGGIAGSAAKIASEAVYPPRTLGQTPPPVVLAERIAGHPLSPRQQLVSMEAIHWTFGVAAGAIYGGAAEVVPLVRIGYGVVFGLVLQLFTHESTVPLLGLDKPPLQQPLREHASEFVSHGFYGLATEIVRRLVRRRLP